MEEQRIKSLYAGAARQLVSLEGDRGRIDCWRVAPSAYASHVTGYLSQDMAGLIIKHADPLYALGAVAGFHYWFEMTGYDSQARIDLTNWVLRNRAHSRLYIGLRSRLVAMGVSVANLALGNLIETFSTPAKLDALLEERLRAAR